MVAKDAATVARLSKAAETAGDLPGLSVGRSQLEAKFKHAADFGVTSVLIQRDDHTPERVSTVFWFNLMVSTGLFMLLLGRGRLGWA